MSRSRVTSYQRRANDRRRFWSDYPAAVAHWAAWDTGSPEDTHFLRALYVAKKLYDRRVRRYR